MSQSAAGDDSFVDGGPLYALFVKFGLGKPGSAGLAGRITFFILVSWLVAAVLAGLQGVLYNPHLKTPFLFDYAVGVRFLVAGPVLIWSEGFVAPWLRHVIQQFRRLVVPEELAKLEERIGSAWRWKNLLWVEVALVIFAFIRPHISNPFGLNSDVGSWLTIKRDGVDHVSWASYWCMYVSRPFVAWLWFRWQWRYLLWSVLLCRIATVKLQLTPTHPDGAGGLGFVAVGQTKFSVLSFVFAAQVASLAANAILYRGATLESYRYIILGVTVLSIMVILGPLLAFTPLLVECKRRGIFEYGALSDIYVRAYHNKWIKVGESKVAESKVAELKVGESEAGESEVGEPVGGEDASDSPIKSLSNHDKSYSAVTAMKFSVIGKSAVTAVAISALAPFSPLILTLYPLDELLHHMFKSIL